MRRSKTIAILVLCCAASAAASDVRIGVLGLFHPKRLTVRSVGNSWAVISGCGEQVVLDPARAGGRADLTSGKAVQVSTAARSFECSKVTIAARDGSAAEFELSVPGKIHRRYLGVGEASASADELIAVVRMPLESAVASVVAAESGPDTPIEALKAQAVASRSYFAAANAGHTTFDFCDTTHCQFLKELPAADSAAAKATRATAGMVLVYSKSIVSAMYSRSCGGRTKALSDIGVKADGYPYFAVECPYCRRNATLWRRESPRDSTAPLTERERLAIGKEHGWAAIPGNNYRVIDDKGGKILAGRGSGHGVGLCQAGAGAMAREGADFTSILSHYYPNTSIEILH